jgi:hypothetical protein
VSERAESERERAGERARERERECERAQVSETIRRRISRVSLRARRHDRRASLAKILALQDIRGRASSCCAVSGEVCMFLEEEEDTCCAVSKDPAASRVCASVSFCARACCTHASTAAAAAFTPIPLCTTLA